VVLREVNRKAAPISHRGKKRDGNERVKKKINRGNKERKPFSRGSPYQVQLEYLVGYITKDSNRGGGQGLEGPTGGRK